MRHLITLLFLAVGLLGCTASAAGPTRVALNDPQQRIDVFLEQTPTGSDLDTITHRSPEDFRTPVIETTANEIPQQREAVRVFDSRAELKDFMVEVEFINPRSPVEGAWDYGVMFRMREAAQGYRVFMDSDGEWGFRYGEGAPTHTGTLVRWNREMGERNRLRLTVFDTQAFLFVNNVFVVTLDVSAHNEKGTVAAGTGFLPGHTHPDSKTKFQDLKVWNLSPEATIANSALQVSGAATVFKSGNVNRPNFIAHATFQNPTNVQANWDYGFEFRHTGPKHYFAVVLTKQGKCILRYVKEQDGAPHREWQKELDAMGMNLGPGQENEVVLYVNGKSGLLLINGRRLKYVFDLAARTEAGDVQLVGNLAGAMSPQPFFINYRDFEVAPIP